MSRKVIDLNNKASVVDALTTLGKEINDLKEDVEEAIVERDKLAEDYVRVCAENEALRILVKNYCTIPDNISIDNL